MLVLPTEAKGKCTNV